MIIKEAERKAGAEGWTVSAGDHDGGGGGALGGGGGGGGGGSGSAATIDVEVRQPRF